MMFPRIKFVKRGTPDVGVTGEPRMAEPIPNTFTQGCTVNEPGRKATQHARMIRQSRRKVRFFSGARSTFAAVSRGWLECGRRDDQIDSRRTVWLPGSGPAGRGRGHAVVICVFLLPAVRLLHPPPCSR